MESLGSGLILILILSYFGYVLVKSKAYSNRAMAGEESLGWVKRLTFKFVTHYSEPCIGWESQCYTGLCSWHRRDRRFDLNSEYSIFVRIDKAHAGPFIQLYESHYVFEDTCMKYLHLE